MAKPFRIQRESDGAIFESDTPQPVPPGYKEMVASPLTTPEKQELPAWASPTLGGRLPFSTSVTRPQMEMGASMLAPGRGLLTRALGQGAVQAGSSLGHGEGPLQAGVKGTAAAGTTAALGGVGKAAGGLLSKTSLSKHAADVSGKLASELKKRVQWFSEFSDDHPGLQKMLFGQEGWNKLHEGYDKSLKDVIERGKGKMLTLTPEEVQTLGLKAAAPSDPRAAEIAKSLGGSINDPKVQQVLQGLGLGGAQQGAGVQIDAGEAADAITGRWRKNPELYRKIVGMLDDMDIGDPKARSAYKTAMGVRDYFSQTKSFEPGGLDLMKAQSGLRNKTSDQLMRRQLGPFAHILTPGGKMLERGSFAVPGSVLGGVIGGMGGGLAGPYGSAGGALGGAWLGARGGNMIPYYSGIPGRATAGPLQEGISRLGGFLTGQALPENRE